MKQTRAPELAKKLGISKGRAQEAMIKAQLISAILDAASAKRLTHAVMAKRSGLSRSAVTGILAGSLQKVTIARLLRLAEAVGLEAELKIRKAA